MILNRVKELCREKNISVPQLEKALDFGEGAIYKWDSSAPIVTNLKKVADYFGVSVDYFLSDEPQK